MNSIIGFPKPLYIWVLPSVVASVCRWW